MSSTNQCDSAHKQPHSMEITYHLQGFWDITISFHNKVTKETKIHGTCLHIIKAACHKPIGKIMLNMEKLEMFPL